MKPTSTVTWLVVNLKVTMNLLPQKRYRLYSKSMGASGPQPDLYIRTYETHPFEMTHPLHVLTLCGRKSELTVARSAAVSGESLWPQIMILKKI